MGLVYAEVELISGEDLALCRRGRLAESEVKRTIVRARVDTAATLLAINEVLRRRLDLLTLRRDEVELADGSIVELDIVGPVEVRFANRGAIVEAIVLPGQCEVLLGAIPLRAMDVLVEPQTERLIVNPKHPDRAGVLA